MLLQLEVLDIVRAFTDVAFADPLSLVLVAMGGLLVGGASLFVGYLALRGIVAALSPAPGQGPPQQAR